MTVRYLEREIVAVLVYMSRLTRVGLITDSIGCLQVRSGDILPPDERSLPKNTVTDTPTRTSRTGDLSETGKSESGITRQRCETCVRVPEASSMSISSYTTVP